MRDLKCADRPVSAAETAVDATRIAAALKVTRPVSRPLSG
jgi:hypothetical protein